MGEVIDLESYRKRVEREAARGESPSNRQSLGRKRKNDKTGGKKARGPNSRPSKPSLQEPTGKTKIESNDSKSD